MSPAGVRERLPVIALLLLFASPAVVLAGPTTVARIGGAVFLGGATAGLALIVGRRVARPAKVVTVHGATGQSSGRSRRDRVIPAELPPPLGLLVGRDAEIDRMCAALDPTGADPIGPDGPTVIAITGASGLGKSALAVNVAHLVRSQYPDGQLLIRFNTTRRMTADDALAAFVAALKTPAERMPEPEEQERWYRLRSSRGRVLVILDNIDDIGQISRLLPAGPRCAAIVTSRTPIPRLRPQLSVSLAPLDADASRLLLRALLGDRRVDAEPRCTDRIINASAGYLVALQIAGAALAARQHWTLETAVRRMDEVALPLFGGDPLPPFSGVLDLAFALSTEQERIGLRLVGSLGAENVSPWMLGALFRGSSPAGGLPEAATSQILNRLARLRLAERRIDDGSGVPVFRVSSHVRAYARARASVELTRVQQSAATQEFVAEQRRRGEQTPERLLRATVYRLLDQGRLSEALDWAREALKLSQEQRSAVPTGVSAEERLSLTALAEVYAELGWIEEGMTRAEVALRDCVVSDRSRPRALRALGSLQRRLRLVDDAARNLGSALAVAMEIDDIPEAVRVCRELAAVQALSTHPERGIETCERALELCDRLGSLGPRRLPAVLCAYGSVLEHRGEFERAEKVLVEADVLTGDVDLAQQLWRPWIRHQRALVALGAGRYGLSRELSVFALEGFTNLRHRYGTAHSRLAIGQAYLREKRIDKAMSVLEEAHGTLRRCGDRWLEAEAATVLADAYREARRGREAVDLLMSAEQTFIKLGDVASQAETSRLLREVESTLPSPPALTWPMRDSVVRWMPRRQLTS